MARVDVARRRRRRRDGDRGGGLMRGVYAVAGLRGAAVAIADAAEDVLTIAVDVPSGIDADTGESGEAVVRADVTVTFGALKPGLVIGDGPSCAGQVHLVDIGLDLPAPSVE